MRGPGKGADHHTWNEAMAANNEGKGLSVFVDLSLRSAAAFKAVVAFLDSDSGARVRAQLEASEARDENDYGRTKALLRRAAGREDGARTRTNPIVRNGSFRCGNCGFDVPPLSRGERNHCPRCLYSAHVDGDVPGDRAGTCGGLMKAERLELTGGVPRATHRCLTCGFTRRNRLFPDRHPEPDRIEILLPSNASAPSAG